MRFCDIPSFVISCEGDSERRSFTEKKLNEQKINFTFFDASDGYKISKEEFAKQGIFINHAGARGVALSHLRLWQKVVDENLEYAVIYEDDVIFHEHFNYFSEKLWQNSPKNSIIFMGYCCAHLTNEKNERCMEVKVAEAFPMALHGYIISNKVAKWFLENIGEMRENIDIVMQKRYYESKGKRDWKSYIWWNGIFTDERQQSKKFLVYFNGFCYQEHELKLSIHRYGKENEHLYT